MKLLLALAALSAFVLAGCGGTGQQAQAPTPPMEGGKYVIHVTAASHFEPADATVPKGATVVWVVDGGYHDVTEGAAGAAAHAWGSDDALGKKMTAGDRFEHTFDAAGVVHYRCLMHESTGMVGQLTVA